MEIKYSTSFWNLLVDVFKLGGAAFGVSFVKWIACSAAIYSSLAIQDITSWGFIPPTRPKSRKPGRKKTDSEETQTQRVARLSLDEKASKIRELCQQFISRSNLCASQFQDYHLRKQFSHMENSLQQR
ncbi:unnamed protein product [Eruca vesicaria subsp. sativa]|uniref:Uncharacterized protein n=1 Tax=Eruca vesicaria subsp. sativa TaxID=29727 RepID=A0ABC8J4A6_ERUVS|nr:unnamed protein product [Eruca vesicaria subsp. sativa]